MADPPFRFALGQRVGLMGFTNAQNVEMNPIVMARMEDENGLHYALDYKPDGSLVRAWFNELHLYPRP